MNIPKSDQYVSTRRDIYEEMEKIVNDKKDINVKFEVRLHSDSGFLIKRVCAYELVYELNSSISFKDIKEISEMIEAVSNEVIAQKNIEIDSMKENIKKLKSTWHYRLFAKK